MQEIKDLNTYRLSLKEKIVEAATKAFLARGVKAVKMDDIATSLSISKRTVYEIFGDKESLLFESVKMGFEKRQAFMVDFSETHNVMEVVMEVYRQKVEDYQSINYRFYEDLRFYPQVMKYLDDVHQKSHHLFISFMQRGVIEGYFRSDVNYELIGKMFDSIGKYVACEGLYTQYPYEELLSNLMLVPFRGFCTAKGVKILDDVKK